AGIPEDNLTPEVIKQFGHTFTDPTAGVNPREPALSLEQRKEHLALLEAEAKANQWPAYILTTIKRLAVFALLALCLCAAPGCSSQKAAETVELMQKSAVQMDEDYTSLIDPLIENMRQRDIDYADKLYADAVRSVTKRVKTTQQVPILVRTVDAEGKAKETTEYKTVDAETEVVNPATLQALMNQKLQHYAQIEQTVKQIRAKMAKIARNRANIEALADGLRRYFNQKADLYEATNQATDLALQYIDRFLGKKPAEAAALPGP
ncbi:MAG: hypothetical protein HY943_17995, partial [Gammaproteobacteria bacterium]|nr:hypothetical protein [Gammaproteobacteria bacterium]